MRLTTNFTVTSDNYTDIPEAVKLYESLGTYAMFHAVMREKDDPQNFKERPELYEDVLKHVEEGIRLSSNPFTKEKLEAIKTVIYKKMEEQYEKEVKREQKYLQGPLRKDSEQNGALRILIEHTFSIEEVALNKDPGNAFTAKAVLSPGAAIEKYIYYFLIKKDGFDYIRSPDSESNEFTFELFDEAEYDIICAVRNSRGEEKTAGYKESVVIVHN